MFKIWVDGEEEPGEWTLQRVLPNTFPSHGSLGLLAYHVDVTWGDLSIQPPGG